MTAALLRKGLCSVVSVLCLQLVAGMTPDAGAQIPGLPAAASGKPSPEADATFGPFDEWVVSVAFSPDGKQIAVGTYDAVRIVRPSHGEASDSDADGTATAGETGETGAADEAETVISTKLGRVRCLHFSSDGSKLFAGGFRRIAVIDTSEWKVEGELTGHRAYVTGLDLSPDGRSLATSSDDTTLRFWNLSDGDSKVLFQAEEDPVTGVAFSPDGSTLAVASGDETRPTRPGHVRLLNAASGEVIHEFEEHGLATTGVVFSPDGKLVASTSFDETVRLHSAETGELVREYDGHSRPTNAARFLPSGKHIVSASGGRAVGGNDVRLWGTENAETALVIDAHKGPVFAVAVSPDGSRFVTGSRDGTARVWSIGDDSAESGAKNLLGAGTSRLKKLARSLLEKSDQQDGSDKPAPDAEDAEEKEDGKAEGQDGGESDSDQSSGRDDQSRDPADSSEKPDNETSDNSPAPGADDEQPAQTSVTRIGMIGLDTSHCLAFTKLLNDPNAREDIAGFRVVAVYPKGSPDIESSVSRVPRYTKAIKKLGVKIVDELDQLVAQVDAVLLETNDGRPHLEQIVPALKARLPVFVDKPLAGSLTDAVAMYELSRHFNSPFFSSSSLRFSDGPQALRSGSQGKVLGCSTYSPCSLEETHPDLFWYGIHGVEMLFTVMGPGCRSVTRTSTDDFEFVTGKWADGRIGTFRGLRAGKRGYGGTAFCEKGIVPVGKYDGYRPLVVEIAKFFRTGKVPVSQEETLQIYAFMEAADESKRQGGTPVTLESVLEKARREATTKVKAILTSDAR